MTEFSPNLPETGAAALDDETLYADLVGQTAKVDWDEIERFFAKGQVLKVAASLDLVEVAFTVIRDRRDQVAAWQQADELAPLDADTARRWAVGQGTLWAVVTPPWVLVQDTEGALSRH
ncbi:MAG: DUF2288 family protein [Halothiobacillaceae bacterium]|nr:DUF2288 family protein [Halothiobacillaceae bacterium]HER35381.1 DUF2288 family protein [Halothiobacillaceae bacterium]